MSQADMRQWVLAALDQYEARLVRYALRLLGDLDLARDSVQHAFLKLCDEKVAGTLRVPLAEDGTRSVPTTSKHTAAWLFRVCRNRALDHLRHAGRQRQADSNDPTDQPPSRDGDPATAAEDAEIHALLRRLIARLPTSQREAIDLWADGFTYGEIARIIDRHEGHVRVLVHRGLKALRQHPQVRPLLGDDAEIVPPPVGPACRAGVENKPPITPPSQASRSPAPLGTALTEAPLR